MAKQPPKTNPRPLTNPRPGTKVPAEVVPRPKK